MRNTPATRRDCDETIARLAFPSPKFSLSLSLSLPLSLSRTLSRFPPHQADKNYFRSEERLSSAVLDCSGEQSRTGNNKLKRLDPGFPFRLPEKWNLPEYSHREMESRPRRNAAYAPEELSSSRGRSIRRGIRFTYGRKKERDV
jgi:hypothetical protein